MLFRSGPYPEDALVLWASRRIGRPVKWLQTRGECLLGDNHARDQVIRGELALDADGRILGLRAQALSALGGYQSEPGMIPVLFSMSYIPSVYDIKALHVSAKAVFTNAAPTGPYRGAGRPEANYFMERMLGEAAREIGRAHV